VSEPITARRPRVFYGWIIVLVSAIAETTAFGAGAASFGVFLQPMSTALGWSRATLTGAITLQSFANLLISPVLGTLVDRHGPRVIMVFGAAVAGTSYLLMARVTEPWHFYLLYTTAAAFGLQEIGSLVGTTVVAKWFVRRRGRALAFTTLGNNVGGILLAPLSAFLIDAVGWGAAWAVLGFVIVVVVLPPTILFMRRSPEDMGLLPDGDAPQAAAQAGAATSSGSVKQPREEPRWGLRDALRTRTVWILVASFNLASLGISALVYHQVAYFRDAGLSLQDAALNYALFQVSAMIAKLLWGFLAERAPVRYCLMGTFACRGVGFLILLLGGAPERVYWYAVIGGIGGSIASLQPLIWADYYGRAFLGTIRGVLSPFSLLSSLCGPLFAALVYDATGSYDTAFWIFTATLFAAVALMFFARPPLQDVPPGMSPNRAAPGAAQALRESGEEPPKATAP